MKKLLLLAGLLVGLSGCVSQDFKDNKKAAEDVQAYMNTVRPTATLSNVTSIDRPPIVITPIKVDKTPSWLKKVVSVGANKALPISTVLSTMLDGENVTVWFDQDVKSNLAVTVNRRDSIANIINLIESQTQYGLIATEDRLEVRRYLTDTFVLNLPPGNVSGQQGSQGQSSGSEGNTKVEGQFINITFSDRDVVTEVKDAIKIILQDDEDDGGLVGNVEAIPSLTALAVRTTPSRMAQVRQVIQRYQNELSKQAMINIMVLEFRSNLDKDQGIDWSLMRDIGDGTLKFLIPGTTTTAPGLGYGLAFEGSGKWDGTTALIKALEQQGTVSTETPIGFLTQSTQLARITQILKTPYVSDISTEVTDTTTSTSTTRDEVIEGVDMMVSSNVQDDFIWLRTSGKLTKIAGDESQTINEATLRFIQERIADLSFTNKLRYGQTVVIGSIKQQTTAANKSSSFGIDSLGSQASNRETIETLVLLTPRKVQ